MPTIKQRDSKVIWHPYTPMKVWPEAIAITRGEGAYLIDEDGNRYLDAISSWWVTLHGHAHPYIAQKVSEQLSTLEQCIFAGFTHEPAVALAERLLGILPAGMAKIFYSDNGSTAVEVAIKMSLQYWRNKGIKKQKLVAIANAYHGDTFGAMAVSGRSVFTEAFTNFLFDVTFIPFPGEGNNEASIAQLEQLLKEEDVAAFIAEPLIQGSAGMYTYPAATLESYFSLCRKYDTLIIADEVMTGFGRTGPLFACGNMATSPDLVCLSKGLTGGTMPLGVTACTQTIFDAFCDDDRTKMLYHGHSFTANPLACAAALASLDLLLADDCTHARQRISDAHAAFAATTTGHACINDIRHLGTILAIELTSDSASYHSNMRDMLYKFFLDRGIIMRPLGNIIYILPPYCITTHELQTIYFAITELLHTLASARR
ncbi:MAG: adenosylmethionine--8-amino-7-oxononanoate transaminase [Bacteroidota bacterium]